MVGALLLNGGGRPVSRIYLCDARRGAYDHGKRVAQWAPHNSEDHIPQWAFLFASRQGLCGVWCWISFRESLLPHSMIITKQLKCAVQPFPTPPFPAHPSTSSGTHQMPPDLLLYPSLDHREASTRIADPKIVHPPSQDRIDPLNHYPHGLADAASEDLPELSKQLRPLLQLRSIVGSPHPLTTVYATIFKTQECETLPLGQIHHPTLIFIDLDS